MKKYILLFLLMSSVVTTTTYASENSSGVCPKKLLKQSQSLWPDNTAYREGRTGIAASTSDHLTNRSAAKQ